MRTKYTTDYHPKVFSKCFTGRYVEEPVLNQNHNEQDNDDLRRTVRFSSNTPGLAVLKSIGVQDESGMAKSEVPRPVMDKEKFTLVGTTR